MHLLRACGVLCFYHLCEFSAAIVPVLKQICVKPGTLLTLLLQDVLPQCSFCRGGRRWDGWAVTTFRGWRGWKLWANIFPVKIVSNVSCVMCHVSCVLCHVLVDSAEFEGQTYHLLYLKDP